MKAAVNTLLSRQSTLCDIVIIIAALFHYVQRKLAFESLCNFSINKSTLVCNVINTKLCIYPLVQFLLCVPLLKLCAHIVLIIVFFQ